VNGAGPTSAGFALAAAIGERSVVAFELKLTSPSRSPAPSRTSWTNSAAASCASCSLVRPDGGAASVMLPERSNTIITSSGAGGGGGVASPAMTFAIGAYATSHAVGHGPLLNGPPTSFPVLSNSADPELPPA
jgi:hypothetical protein